MPFSDFRLAASATHRARAARFALMGAVAALALGAPAAISLAPARAETAVTAAAPATNAPTSFADVVDRVKPAVVAIKVKGVASDEAQEATGGLPGAPDMSPDDPMYHFFKRFGEQRPGGHLHGQMTMSQGSGFIVSADGYVVTNNHVVEHATEVEVTLDSGKTLAGESNRHGQAHRSCAHQDQ